MAVELSTEAIVSFESNSNFTDQMIFMQLSLSDFVCREAGKQASRQADRETQSYPTLYVMWGL